MKLYVYTLDWYTKKIKENDVEMNETDKTYRCAMKNEVIPGIYTSRVLKTKVPGISNSAYLSLEQNIEVAKAAFQDKYQHKIENAANALKTAQDEMVQFVEANK